MKLIPLTQGQYAQVSDEDYDHLMKFNCYAYRHRHRWYASREEIRHGKRRIIRMHREIISAPPFMPVSFEDGNSLNCQRSNLSMSRSRRPSGPQPSAIDQPALNPSQTATTEGVTTGRAPWIRHIRSLLRPLRP